MGLIFPEKKPPISMGIKPRPQEYGSAGGAGYRGGSASDADVAFEGRDQRRQRVPVQVRSWHDHETLVLTQTRTGGDEVTTDDVLLEAFERRPYR